MVQGMENLYRTPHAIVIGAGLAGLTVAHYLQSEGVETLVLDGAPDAASSWKARHPQLLLNTHRSLSQLPGLRYPPGTPSFPPRDAVIAHLQEFSRHARFPIRYNAKVERVHARPEGGYRVELGTEAIDCAHVIVATGRDRLPVWPEIEGLAGFTGTVLHAAEFGEARAYDGRRLLVVGGGNSGFDIVNHLSRGRPACLWMAVRSASAILPRRLKGVAVHRFSPLMEKLPGAVADLAMGLVERLAFGPRGKLGLPKPPGGVATRLRLEHVAIPIDDGAIRSMAEGRTRVVPPVTRIEGSHVILADGTVIEPDTILFATGYRTGLEPLVGTLGVLDAAGVPRLEDGFRSAREGLWFAGMIPNLVSYFYSADREGRAIARAIAKDRPDRA